MPRAPWEVVVVGAGPAGLLAALAAAQEGAAVLVLERGKEPGGKLPYAGGGRGNLSHTGEVPELLRHYHGGRRAGEAARFLRPALYAFSNRDLAAFFAARGLPLVAEADGRLFPKTGRARDALVVLLTELDRLGVALRLEARVQELRRARGVFRIQGEGGLRAEGRAVVLATGGRARNPEPDGYRLAAGFGHRLVPPRPALVPVRVEPAAFAPFRACAGVSLPSTRVLLVRGGRTLAQKEGAVLFTHVGLSGPAILDLSREVDPGDVLRVALAPGLRTPVEAERRLLERARGKRQLATVLRGLGLPRGLARALLAAVGLGPEQRAAELPREARRGLAESLALGHPFPVAALGDWAEAMATRGGIALEEVDPKTMGSRLVPGLFFAGEILDFDGESGGYNLQAAFSTGYLAGRSAARFVREQRRHGARLG
ncbi:MAG: aminoacetone oxidase family FAD-binding enzyme [Candidatus Bipolaricaulota bacterium]|nr:aminoacetone oxidase family FAD-binding enzyme [Candidatus Bipolaricaulota bacterium]